MLTMVKTKVTVTYDIDALLPVQSYVTARNAITKQGYSCVTPESGESKRFSIDREHKVILSKTLNLNSLPKNELVPKRGGPARFGLAIFMNTKTYRELGGENENFISWGWEDHDRIMRFRRMKYKVGTLDNTPVKRNSYHLEHERGINSWKISPYYKTNEATLEKTKRFLNQRRRENIPIEEVAKLCIRRPGNQP
ncbi:MAG: galactosyltransferase-related protein [archaeon]|jgi:hypothetical protein|nr:galactosyltransferase-related protein [archaeon]